MIKICRAAIAAATLVVVIAGCSDDEPSSAASSTTTRAESTTTTVDTSYAGLCEAISFASAGDKQRVATVFDHGPLHELAEAAAETDRGAAARLLEAKEEVESGITDETVTAPDLAADLTALADATRATQQVVGDPVLPNCP